MEELRSRDRLITQLERQLAQQDTRNQLLREEVSTVS